MKLYVTCRYNNKINNIYTVAVKWDYYGFQHIIEILVGTEGMEETIHTCRSCINTENQQALVSNY